MKDEERGFFICIRKEKLNDMIILVSSLKIG